MDQQMEQESTKNNDEKYYFKLFLIGSVAIILITGTGLGLYYGLKDRNLPTNYMGSYVSDSKLGEYKEFAVSTDSEPCALIGKNILLKGGNAVDAVISVLLCMGVTIPESMGLGGGSLITIYNATTGESTAIDAREKAPSASTEDMYNKTGYQNSEVGPLSIGVPGELAGYWKMFQNHSSGSIEWKDLFTDTIKLCEEGFKVSQHLNDALIQYKDTIMIHKSLSDIYVNPNTGKTYSTGEILIQTQLGDTLRKISEADNPMDFFYKNLSQLIVDDIKKSENSWNITTNITVEDFMNYTAVVRDPVVTTNLRGNITLHTFPLPGSGNLLSFVLKVMQSYEELYPCAGDSLSDSTLFYHRLVETFKFAFSMRMHLGDSDFDNVTDVINNLTSNHFIDEVIEKIDDKQTYNSSSNHYDPQVFFDYSGGTAHVAVIDKMGNAVSVSSTVNLYFGSKVMSNSTGIILNDEMDDFNTGEENSFGIPPSDKNKIEPNKRPLSSMVPSIFTDKNGVRLVIGGSGGPKITTATAFVAIRHLWMAEDIKTAIDAPRIHHQLFPDKIVYESNFPQNILNNLKEKGHQIEELPKGERGAVIMAITRNNGKIYANSDYRKGGTVDGV